MLARQSAGMLFHVQAARRKSGVLRGILLKYPGRSRATFGCSSQAEDDLRSGQACLNN